MMWDVSTGIPAMQAFLGQVEHILSNSFQDPSLVEMESHMTVVQWFESWWKRFYWLEVESRLAVE